MEFSESVAFGSVGCKICWVCEVLTEGVGYGFVGVVSGVFEFYRVVGFCSGGSLLFIDLIAFQYVIWFCLLSHGVFTWFCQMCYCVLLNFD